MIDEASRNETREFLAPLGLMLPITVEDVKKAYLARVSMTHPDTGGDVESFKRLQRAYERGLDHARRHDFRWIGSMVETYVEQQGVIGKVMVLGGLRWLDLSRTRITYRGLKLLCRLPKLQSVRLHETPISWWERFKLRWAFWRLGCSYRTSVFR